MQTKVILRNVAYVMLFFVFTAYTIISILFFQGKSIKDYQSSDIEKSYLAEQLVKALYDFNSVYELDANMAIVQELTSESVYNDLTIDNEQRTMLTYMKFRKSSSHVIILDSNDSYVRYKIDSPVIESDREFILFYQMDEYGIIYEVEEAEVVKYLDTIY